MIILRKFKGELGAFIGSHGGRRFGTGSSKSNRFGFLFSPLLLLILVLAVVAAVAWAYTHGGLHPAAGLVGMPLAPFFAGETALVERREELHAKQKTLLEVVEAAGKDLDFSKKTVLEKLGATDAAGATLKFQALNKEAEHLGLELQREELKATARSVREREDELARPADDNGMRHSAYGDNGKRKSWARQYVESKEFKASRETQQDIPFELENIESKTLFETGAGFAIENVRSGLLVPMATRPIAVIDLIPSFPINQSAFVYMEETTRTVNAAERAEGTAYPESAFVWTQKSSPVQKIADSIPVTDEQLEDADQVQSLLEQRLSFGLRQRLDLQLLVGTGASPLLRGINAVVGIQVQAKGADNGIVAFLKAMTLVRFTGRAIPTGAVFHPNDWLDIMLTQSTAGEFLFGNPFQGPGPTTLFGVPVAQTDAQTQNTGLVGDFANFSRLDDRRGVRVQTGYVGTQFTDGKVTLRADMRAAFTVTRPAAFAQITGI
jgi:HK97 family phage major capsid protein